MKPHETFVHGGRREGFWWGCATCGGERPNSFVFHRDAEAAAAGHRRAVELANETDSGDGGL